MSFWPFGLQSPRKSNIDYLLNDYFDLLKRLETSENSMVSFEGVSTSSSVIDSNCNTGMKTTLFHDEDNDTISPVVTNSLKGHNISIEQTNSNNDTDGHDDGSNDADNNYFYDLNKINSLKIEDIMSYNNNNNKNSDTIISNKLDSIVSPSKSSISSLLFFTSNDTCINTNNNDSTNINYDYNLSVWSKLNSSFIEKILKEDNLIEELSSSDSPNGNNNNCDNLSNSRLVDFLCLGYFFDENTGLMVHHIDYLIDKLLWCLDNIDKKTLLMRNDTYFNDISDYLRSLNTDTNFNNNNNIPVIQNTTNGIFPVNNNKTFNDNDSYSLIFLATCISDILSQNNIWLITELLVKSRERLMKLWSILNNKNCQSERSLHISIFLKIHESLLLSRQTDYLNFIRSLPTLINDILRHNNIPILFDFLLKLISTDKPECPTGIIDTVYDQDLIPKCLKFFNNNKYSDSVQTCITDFLKMLVEISSSIPIDDSNIGPNKLTRQLCSSEIMKQLVDIVLAEGGSALCNIVTIIIELIRKNNSDYDKLYTDKLFLDTERTVSDRDPIYLGDLLQSFTERLTELIQPVKKDLIDSPKFIKTRNNTTYVPIGMVKLRILELIAELLHCSNMTSLNLHVSKHFSLKTNQDRSLLEIKLSESQIDDNNYFSIANEDDLIKAATVSEPVKKYTSNGSKKVNFEETDKPYCISNISSQLNVTLRENAMVGDQFKIKLFDQNFLPKLISLILKCPWNNMFHNVIVDIIQQVLNGRIDSSSYNVFLVYSLFFPMESVNYIENISDDINVLQNQIVASITDTIIEAYKQNYKFYESNNTALGYMGHLVIITEEVLKFLHRSNVSKISLEFTKIINNESWNYIVNVLLNDMRVMYSGILGGGNYVDDGNGNLIPQIPISGSPLITNDFDIINNQRENEGTDIISQSETQEDNRLDNMMTETQLYDKLKILFTISDKTSDENTNGREKINVKK